MSCDACCIAISTQYLCSMKSDDLGGPAARRGGLRPRRALGDGNPSGGPAMDELSAVGGVIRKLWIGEVHHDYLDHLLRLDAESRRNRFGLALADELIEAYVASPSWSGAVLHGFLVDGVLRGVAELKPFGAAFPTEAEAAFSVEKPWQSHGIGAALLGRTLLAARNRGIGKVHMVCLADNARM